jgi:hypothetical protein
VEQETSFARRTRQVSAWCSKKGCLVIGLHPANKHVFERNVDKELSKIQKRKEALKALLNAKHTVPRS